MKAGWKTTEFWVLIGSVVAKTFIPSVPDELIALAGTYIVGRAGQKSVTALAKAKESTGGK